MKFYSFARGLCRLYLKTFRRWEIEGEENIPSQGPVIIASNHISYLDPVVVGCAFNREISFLAKEELFEIPILRTIISNLNAFPVKRGSGDRGAIRAALELLAQGECFGIFPEGHRNRTQAPLTPFKAGVALLAIKSGAPVLPVALDGTKGFFSRVRIKIGPPISMEDRGKKLDKSKMAALTDQVETAVSLLLGKLAKDQ